MAQPTAYSPATDFSDFEASNPSTPKGGAALDTEFTALELTTDEILANLALIQADDGSLKNEVVSPDKLTPAALALITGGYDFRGDWLTGQSYLVGDMVRQNSLSYVCVVAHTSGTFSTDLAAEKWFLFATTETTQAALDAQVAAEAAQTAAETAETNAETAETAAEAAQAYAEEWANKAEDSLVSAAAGGDESTEYSARHWAAKTAADAIATAADAVSTGDDATATAADAIATAADRVQTGLDAIAAAGSASDASDSAAAAAASAASINVGTDVGDLVALIDDGAGSPTFPAAVVREIADGAVLESTDGGASVDPVLYIDRLSPSAANNDLAGSIFFRANDDAQTRKDVGDLTAFIRDAAAATFTGGWLVSTNYQNTKTIRFAFERGLSVGGLAYIVSNPAAAGVIQAEAAVISPDFASLSGAAVNLSSGGTPRLTISANGATVTLQNAAAWRTGLGLGSLATLSSGDTVTVTADGSTTARDLSARFADVFHVGDFGAVADAVAVADGAISSSDATFTSASSSFTAADIGKAITVAGAGAAGVALKTTIASINSGTSVELDDAASTTVSSATAVYGTDNETAINAALAAAISAGAGTVLLGAGQYFMTATLAGTLAQGVRVGIVGQGKDASQLVFDDGVDGLDIDIDGDDRNNGAIFLYDDFTLATVSDVAGTAATFTGTRTAGMTTAMLSSSRVKMKGVDESKGWGEGATHSDVAGVKYLFPEWLGKMFDKTANAFEFSGANSPADVQIIAPRATFFATAVLVSGTVEGVLINQPMFVSGAYGVQHSTSGIEPQLEIHGGHINAHTAGVVAANLVQSVIEGCLFYEDPAGGPSVWVAMQFSAPVDLRIYGNTIHGWNSDATTRYGISLLGAARRTLMFGNTFRGYDGTDKLSAAFVFSGSENGSVSAFGNVFDDTTVTARVAGGIATGAFKLTTYANSIVPTLTGGAATETLDVAVPAGLFSGDPLDATLTDQSGANYLVAIYDYGNAATTPTNCRFTITRADGTNITAGAHRFGFKASGV